ncbi:MAG: AgmX/PglI C-terminal domain-containing protein [Candidatus Binatota bacterium]|nr:AgmX/PglI C-terminal domain-containing protein [Candidatus Binatota bacterium]
MDHNGGKAGGFGLKGLIVVVVWTIGLGVMLYHSGIGRESSKKPAPPPDKLARKPVHTMNMALGPMVFLARDLGFSVKTAKGESMQDTRIAARIENQLQGVRDLYRQEIARNGRLVGSLILQFSVNPAGEVSQVREVSSRINDAEFKKTVLAETGKWTFTELLTDTITVQCPLLFVQEGMDITTLVRWESSLNNAIEKVAATPAAKPEIVQQAKTTAAVTPPAAINKPAPVTVKPAPAALVKADGEQVQIKYATLLRKEPNFNAPVLATFTIGTKVTVISRSGEWLEVRPHHNGPSGYIRREFAVPVDVAVNR